MSTRTFQDQYPIQFALPRSGERDHYFAQSRTWWYEKSVPCKANNFRPPVKSIVVRKPGNVKGRRFIVFESARAYFASLEINENTSVEQ